MNQLAVPPEREWHGGPISLGPFDLLSVLGVGGMAEVWLAVHRQEGREVAVKVMTGDRALESKFVTAFRREVQSVATLDHEHIVTVLDYGFISPAAEHLSHGRLLTGSPYLTMSLTRGGDLVTRWGVDGGHWSSVLAVLKALLAALAHAHARGIIHRDIKGDNLLWFETERVWKLTDFGIAHAFDRTGESRIVGTPQYMAPEQYACSWRDFGPWTDLYSTAVLTYEMVTGQLPFSGADARELGRQHLKEEPPPLSPLMPVPQGFESWLRRMLHKRPIDRFQTAADALRSLVELGDPPRQAGIPRRDGTVGRSTDSMVVMSREVGLQRTFARTTGDHAAAGIGRPPFPVTWRRARQRTRMLKGAGIGLYGLRSIPVVGRFEERDALWESLRDVYDTRRAGLVLLRGVAGTGKSRLAQWLVEESHELGVADNLRAFHSPDADAGHGLARAVSRYLRCVGASDEERLERVEKWCRQRGAVEAWEWTQLDRLMDESAPDDAEAPVRAPNLRQPRFAALAAMLSRVAGDRAVILWLDDVQWGEEALAFAKWLLDGRQTRTVPVLAVLTIREESLADSPDIGPALDRLAGPAARRLEIGSLEDVATYDLVGSLLGLSGDLAHEVVQQSAGNPLFVVQMVGDWVHRGLLKPGEGCYELTDSAEVALPDSLHHVWGASLSTVLADRPRADAIALEVAAALGHEVDALEWRAACVMASAEPSDDLVEVLVERRLAEWTETGWAFIHGMLRASLERRAREGNRWADQNRVCAELITAATLKDHTQPQHVRLGRHFMAAGDDERAARCLLQGASQRSYVGDFRTGQTLLEQRDDALKRLRLPRDDPRWGAGWVLRAKIAGWQGRWDEANEWAEKVTEAARTFEWGEILPPALLEQARVWGGRGMLRESIEIHEAAIDAYTALGNHLGAAHAKLHLAHCLTMLGELDQAAELLRVAKARCDEDFDLEGITTAVVMLANIALTREELDEAHTGFERARRHYAKQRDRVGELQCLNGLGEVARGRGRHGEALEIYQRVLTEWEGMGSNWVNVGRINVGLCHLAMGAFDEAEQVFGEAAHDLGRRGQFDMLGGVHAELLPCVAARSDWLAWDHHLETARHYLDMSGIADPDDAWPLQLAGDLARQAGEDHRAFDAYELARDLWLQLGNAAQVEALDKTLEEISEAETDQTLT